MELRPEIATVIDIIFSKKSVLMCGNLDCNKWFIWFETRLAWWPHRSSPISVPSLISTSKTGVHFKMCFLLKLPRNFWSSEFLFSFSFETRNTQIVCRALLVYQPIQSPKVFHLEETISSALFFKESANLPF